MLQGSWSRTMLAIHSHARSPSRSSSVVSLLRLMMIHPACLNHCDPWPAFSKFPLSRLCKYFFVLISRNPTVGLSQYVEWGAQWAQATLHVGELWTSRRNSRDTTGEGCELFCNSCFNKQSVTVTVTVTVRVVFVKFTSSTYSALSSRWQRVFHSSSNRQALSDASRSRSRSRSRIIYYNTSYRKVYTLPPSCPGSYADLFRAPLHEVCLSPAPTPRLERWGMLTTFNVNWNRRQKFAPRGLQLTLTYIFLGVWNAHLNFIEMNIHFTPFLFGAVTLGF